MGSSRSQIIQLKRKLANYVIELYPMRTKKHSMKIFFCYLEECFLDLKFKKGIKKSSNLKFSRRINEIKQEKDRIALNYQVNEDCLDAQKIKLKFVNKYFQIYKASKTQFYN